MTGAVAARLAEFAGCGDVPGDALAVLRLSLLDWCAVTHAGRDEPVARILRDQALEEGGAAQASVVGSRTRLPARAAALVNGTVSHALDYDDTHFAHIGHPSVAVLPAVLALSQWRGASGPETQRAALLGIEASIRVGVWLGRDHYQAGFHQTGTAGAFGACLGACRLLGLDSTGTEQALGLVATRASGLKSQFGTMGKPLNAGLAAANGVEAALLAGRGFISRPAAVDGPQGFGATHHGMADDAAWDGLGTEWRIIGISHKLHACCHGLHAMLEALAPLAGTDAGAIAGVEVSTHPRWLSVCNIAAPATGLEAKFSYRMAAAMRLGGVDTAQPGSYTDALCRDAKLVALRDRVRVSAEDALSETQARVRVTWHDGTARTFSHDLAAPVPLQERRGRVMNKARTLLGAGRAEALWQAIADEAPADRILAELDL